MTKLKKLNICAIEREALKYFFSGYMGDWQKDHDNQNVPLCIARDLWKRARKTARHYTIRNHR